MKETEEAVWTTALMSSLSREMVSAPKDVAIAAKIADAALEEWRLRFNPKEEQP